MDVQNFCGYFHLNALQIRKNSSGQPGAHLARLAVSTEWVLFQTNKVSLHYTGWVWKQLHSMVHFGRLVFHRANGVWSIWWLNCQPLDTAFLTHDSLPPTHASGGTKYVWYSIPCWAAVSIIYTAANISHLRIWTILTSFPGPTQLLIHCGTIKQERAW